MNACHALACIVGLAVGVNAAPLPLPAQRPVQSASGQFTVLRTGSPGTSASSAVLSASDLLHLEPTLLTISAERLRQYLTRQLQDKSPWEGRILFSLREADSFEAPVEVVAERLPDRWQYQVSLPEYIQQERFIRALVEVNLMEIANRNASGRAAEIPAWLTEGLTAHLLVSRSIEIILPTPKLKLNGVSVTPWVVEDVNYQPLALAHQELQTQPPLTIEQLSWPTPDSFEGRSGQTYRNCAQLLVSRLLELPNGHALINAFIRNLGQHYNWQVAFLDTYHTQFSSLLALEKWWALQLAYFTGRELGSCYSYAESVSRLNQAVRCPVEVRVATNTLPMHVAVSLQTIIEEWDANEQTRALEQSLTSLTVLRARIAPELLPLLDDYRQTLRHYLQNRNRAGIYLPKGANRQASLTRLIRRTLTALDKLDAELDGLVPEPADNPALADSPR